MDTPSIPQKQCKDCKGWFPATAEYFHERKKGSGKLRPRCLPCYRKYTAEGKRRRYWENPEKGREKNKQDSQIHRDRHREEVRQNDRERRLARFLADPEKERERDRVRNAKWREKNPSKHRTRIHRSRIKRKQRLLEVSDIPSFTAEDVLLHLKSQRGKCWWCGKKFKGNEYHIDHRIPIARGGTNDASNICLACAKCNLSKNSKMPWEWNGRML